MMKNLMALATMPLLVSTAFAGQPLSDRQMDRVTAGYDIGYYGDPVVTSCQCVGLGYYGPGLGLGYYYFSDIRPQF